MIFSQFFVSVQIRQNVFTADLSLPNATVLGKSKDGLLIPPLQTAGADWSAEHCSA
jgi:hypothetical protein